MRKISGAHRQHKMGMRISGGFEGLRGRKLTFGTNAIEREP